METPSAAPSPTLWQTLPEKLLLLSMHHLARLITLLRGPLPSPPNSSEMALDILLMHLQLSRPTRDSRPGWTRVELTPDGEALARYWIELAVGPVTLSSSSTASDPTPGQPSTPAGSRPPVPLSLVHSRP